MPQRTSHDRRLERIATTDEYAQAVERRFGFAPVGVGALLDIAQKLLQPSGGTITRDDIATLQALHPDSDPRAIAATAAAINAEPPKLRGQYFIASLTEDRAVAADLLHEASPRYREVEKLARGWVDETYIEELQRRRDLPVGKEKQPEITRPPEDPHSIRSILERSMNPGRAELMDAIDRGVPEVEGGVRELMAQHLDRASETLWSDEGREKASLRDTLDAAWTSEAVEAEAVNQGWLPAEES